jgi:asparagine synthase (glutamine-hydrolysing)
MSEENHQRSMALLLGAKHHEVQFDTPDIVRLLQTAIYHAECPLKETYNTACLALSATARENQVPVVLTGQGADESFAGYIGYRFDSFYQAQPKKLTTEEEAERQIRRQLWGDPDIVYEGNYANLRRLKKELYSEAANERLEEWDSFRSLPINSTRLRGRHMIHQRSYLDHKLRLSDHLLSDHGDRMAMANGVEVRHPFLDIDLVQFATQIPPELKLNSLEEKYILKQASRSWISPEIINREKFGWYAPGSPALIRGGSAWVKDLLSYDRIKRQGYFNPDTVEKLKKQYSATRFRLNQPFETDLLTLALTFGIFLDVYEMPSLN